MLLKDLKKGDIFSYVVGKDRLRHVVVGFIKEPGKHEIHYRELDDTNLPGPKTRVDLLESDWPEVEIVR